MFLQETCIVIFNIGKTYSLFKYYFKYSNFKFPQSYTIK